MISCHIYDKNGVVKNAVIDTLELHDEWMAECYVTASVKSPVPIDFEVGDYILYRGEQYTIQYSPNLLKKATSGSYQEGFVYDNIKFVGSQDDVVRCDFNDIVLNDNEMHYTALSTFPFYCESVDDLLDRIQANLEDLYPGQWIIIGLNTVRNYQRGTAVGRASAFDEAYRTYVDPTGTAKTDPYGKQGVAESVDNITCWDAMKKVHDDFDLNFIVRGRVIIVGTAGVFTANTFRYGKGNGLYEIERVGDSDQQIVTRLRAYGSETNLPSHYYATLNKQVYATVTTIKNKFGTTGVDFLLDLDFDRKYFTYRSESYPGTTEAPNYIIEMMANDVTVRGYVTKDSITGKCYVYCESVAGDDDRDEPDAEKMAAFVQALTENDRLDFVDYVNKDTFGEGHYDYSSENLPDNMAVSRLMLPGFPNQSLDSWVQAHKNLTGFEWLAQAVADGFTFSTDKYRPYIDSPNISQYGIRPASIYFDGSDETDDIHPTIEGMEHDNAPVDEVYAADQVEDNGVYPAGDEVKNINITLPNLGFELDKVYEDGASIDMKNGMCGARSFKIAKKPTKDANNRWLCNVERVHDESLDLWFPYCDFQIHGSSEQGREHGDKYVLTGITMPDAYIDFAAVKLLRASIEALKKNHAPRYTYQPRIDEIFMQRQHDTAISSQGVVSLHDTLKAGDIFSFADDDLNIDANIIIDVLTIKENGNNGIPTYEVTLRDEKQVGTIQKITNKVESIISGATSINGATGGLSVQQVRSIINNFGGSQFLSKLNDDTAQGNIGLLKGVWFGIKKWFVDHMGNANLNTLNVEGGITANDIRSTNYTGDGMFDTGGLWQYLNGKMKIVADQIVCRGKFVVNEIENRIWTYAGGNMIFSAAGSTIFHVEYLDAYNNPLGYTTINSPWLLKKIPLLAGVIAWSRRRQIRRELTPAEREQVVKFRCYEMSDDGTMQTRNWWKIDDIAYCQTLNKVKNKGASNGSYSGSLSNTVYARRVVGIGSKEIAVAEDGKIYDYVDLSVSDCDQTYNDWPAAGDVIVQRGNKTDNERQGFTTIEVTGTQRGVKVYDNVSGYSMEGKRQAFFGYDADTKRAMLEVFGDAYIGARGQQNPHDGSTYLRYNANTGVLELKAVIDAQSTVNNQAITDYINGLITSITDAIQQQVDKKAETWYQSTDPSGAWTDATTKAKHVGDLWYDTSTGKSYYYNSNYQWKYENIPNEVFDTIDGKAAIYVSWGAWGNNLHVRDLYIPSADYGDYKKDKVYRCTNASTPAFKEVDYSNDDAFNNWKANGYADDISGLSTRINSAQSTANGAKSKVDALDAVKGALNGATLVDGGLLLTSLIGLRKKVGDNYVTYGGLNGVWNDILGGKTIAAWFGGGMSEQDAKILFRMDGSGFMAGNKFLWDEDGNATIGGFTIGTDHIGQNTTMADGKGFTYIMRNGQIYVWNNDTSRAALRVNGGVEMLGTSNQPISIGNTSTGGNIHVNAHSLNLNTGATSGSTTTIGNSQSSLKIEANQTTFDNAASFGSTLDVSGLATLAGNIRTGTSLTLPGTTSNPPKLGTFFFCKSTSGDMTVYIPPGFKLLKSGDNGEREGSVNIGERSDIIVYMGNMKWVEYWCG